MHAKGMQLPVRAIYFRACRSAILAGSVALAASNALAQRTLHVAPGGTHDSAGYFPDWAGASTSIQAAVNLATNGDVVLVTNYPSPYLLDSNIVVASSITLRSYHAGVQDPTNTILDGQGKARCLYLSSAGAVVSGFTLTNGNGRGHTDLASGGGAYIAAGTLSNCVLSGNTADLRGGGVFATGAGSLVTDCLIAGNVQTNSGNDIANVGGGGAYLQSSAKLRRSRLFNNRAMIQRHYTGGGGAFLYGIADMTDCIVSGNVADVQGGGVMLSNFGASQLFRGNVIVDNQVTNFVYQGGAFTCGGGLGVYAPSSNSLIADCEVSENTGAYFGGGISIYHGAASGCIVSGCVVRGNSSVRYGGGIGQATLVGQAMTNNDIDFRILNSEISGNKLIIDSSAFGRGGGISFFYTGLWVEHCVISNNQSHSYAGVYYVYPTTNRPFVVRNCLIVDNTATGASGIVGGLQVLENGWIENCTIAGNQAVSQYGGMYVAAGGSVSNTVCYFNSAPAHPDWSAVGGVSLGYNCFPTNDFVQWPTVITNAPVFVNTNAGDYRLDSGSPGVNAGGNLPWMTGAVDLDGRPRLDRLARRVDIGCYERIPQVSLINIR